MGKYKALLAVSCRTLEELHLIGYGCTHTTGASSVGTVTEATRMCGK
jgi:hypothetical protein